MITKAKRKSRLIKRFTKGAIRLSTANGSNVRKNKMCHHFGFIHCLCGGAIFEELKVDIMQFMGNESRMKNIERRENFIKEHYGEEYTYKQVMESIRIQKKEIVKREVEVLKKYGFGEVK
ncbi:MAG: hypothetical protein ACRCW9_07520 [Cetobacterium sp.]